jgi:thymidylate kinase
MVSDEPRHAAERDHLNPDPTTQSMMYTADRRSHMQYVQEWLEWHSVICDRGPVSTMVYQGLVGGVDLDWLLSLNRVAMEGVEVAATILLHAPFETTVQRIEGRGTPLTQQERDQLRPAWEAYESLRLGAHDPNGYPWRIRIQQMMAKWKSITGWIYYIDANRPAAEVEADVIATIDKIIQGA